LTVTTSRSSADATYVKLLKKASVPNVLAATTLRDLGELVEPLGTGAVGTVAVSPPPPPPPHALRSKRVSIEGRILGDMEPLRSSEKGNGLDSEATRQGHAEGRSDVTG
jgi:hypothetical protein